MNEDALKYLRDDFNELRLKVERNEQRLFYVDENSKGSLTTREERAATTSAMRTNIKEIFSRLAALENADKELNARFFQVWMGVGFVCLGIIVDFIITLRT
jgi:hypothetical protein